MHPRWRRFPPLPIARDRPEDCRRIRPHRTPWRPEEWKSGIPLLERDRRKKLFHDVRLPWAEATGAVRFDSTRKANLVGRNGISLSVGSESCFDLRFKAAPTQFRDIAQ